MTVYQRETAAMRKSLTAVMKAYHPGLVDAGVTVDLIRVHASTDANGDPKGPALKHGGYQAAAVVRIVGTKERVAGRGDAEIVVDGDRWDEWNDEERAAIFDHELTHLELKTIGETATVDRDDLDRPKLKMRLHDRQFGWFDAVARRHGKHSVEVMQARDAFESVAFQQMYLPGFEPAEAVA